METIIIGIAGGSGSGKTTIAEYIQKKCSFDIPIISHDSYYRAQETVRPDTNYDEPAAFETELLIEHINKLKNGESVSVPEYDYEKHTRKPGGGITVHPCRVIILEGILIFSDKKLLELIDIKLFVDADADIRILRRIKRDINKRGRSIESIEAQYLGSVREMHEKYVEPAKWLADLIIPNNGLYNTNGTYASENISKTAIEVICDKIEKLMAESSIIHSPSV